MFCVILFLQYASGAFHSEFAGYPDEPAHYVTGLMVRDFIAQPSWLSPTHFAETYYAHYPKVAFGHWPPLLYLVQAFWMLVFSGSRASVLLELTLLTAILAFSVYTLERRLLGWKLGAIAAALTVCLPEIQRYTDEVMAETLLVLVSLWAAVFFIRYLESERWQDSLWFGVFTSLAVLTKGNGWELGFVPPVAFLLTRRWRLLTRPSFWLAPLVVAVLCLPWQIWSFPMAHRGWTGGDRPNAAFTLQAMGAFLIILNQFMGTILTAVALLGISITVIFPAVREGVQPVWAVFFGLIFGVWAFHVIVPAGIESRKMVVAIPALILFLFAGGKWLNDRLPKTRWTPALVGLLAVVAFATQTFAVPAEKRYGFTEAAEFLTAKTDPGDLSALVSSQHDGEGLLIAEVAMHDVHRPNHTILRGSRVLSNSDWTGGSYECSLRTVADLETSIAKTGARLVVIDTYPAQIRYLHHQLILQAIRENPKEWKLAATFHGEPGTAGEVRVYLFTPRV